MNGAYRRLSAFKEPTALHADRYNGTTKNGVVTARQLTDAEIAKAMKVAEHASEMASTIAAASTFEGLIQPA